MKARDARRRALALPESTEQDHHGFPSFRVGGKLFATLPDDEHLHVMLGPDETARALETAPEACEELRWGRRLAGVRVTLTAAQGPWLDALLKSAWLDKAPRRLGRPARP